MMSALMEKYPTEVKIPKRFVMNETSLANFTKAYNLAVLSGNNKELFKCVCAMISYVFSELQTSVGTALGALGIYPGAWRLSDYESGLLPSYGGFQTMELDWPSVLVYFGCCILLLFKEFTNEENYNTFMTNSIRELRVKTKCDPDVKLDDPFNFKKANAIKVMLGACSTLCKDAITFLLKYMNCENSVIASVCHYLVNALAWVDMRHLVLMNDFLLMPQSPVLHDLRVSREVENINVAIAKELERGYNNNNVVKFESVSTTGANQAMVQSLVTLHQSAFPQNGSSSSNVQTVQVKRENPQILSRTSNVQMPPVKQEKSSFERRHVIILD